MRPVFVGLEPSQAPEVVELVALGRKIGAALGPRAAGALALRNGPRCIVNGEGAPLPALGLGDFVEVADYDHATQQVLCLGTRAPDPDAPLLSLVFRAKAEVGAAALLRLAPGHEALADVEGVERDARPIIVATSVLRLLRETDAAVLGGADLLLVAPNLPRLAARLDAALAKAPPVRAAGAADARPQQPDAMDPHGALLGTDPTRRQAGP